MLYHLSLLLKTYCSFFNVIHYISFRASVALLTSLILMLIFGKWFIAYSEKHFQSAPREFTPETHKKKNNIPIMGGILVIAVVVGTVFLWGNLGSASVWLMLLTLSMFGFIGFWDDWKKIFYKKGFAAWQKFGLQLLAATSIVLLWYILIHPSTLVWFPFFKNIHPDFGWWFFVWAAFIIIGASNAVNLTDGLDGLATTSLIANFATFSLICYVAGHLKIAQYLAIPFAGCAELAVVGAAIVGALFGFLWFNTYPAQIFLGDVGSLGLGAALALIALMAKQELLLPLSGGLFVVEALSVIIQVLSFKLRGKRVFKMAPLHHHYELLGWPEAKITVRFGIISLVLCLVILMTLKIR
ncbi:TPA: phospho-N-acetylmuramoyl-pentapeptide-transferase [Candidatus Dependentiae bacterium]|nr:phospho-N-acetylmuramoyl-pentapeptide-transferase [Candidatus Dependentiae bacterium]HCU00129.1 phospho-N-acetylmuramoyl-pentapeptide-transferase [Candidatus Dependentiae bacterium]